MARLWSGRAAIAIGFGSALDIYGIGTYRAMLRLQQQEVYRSWGFNWRNDVARATIPALRSLGRYPEA